MHTTSLTADGSHIVCGVSTKTSCSYRLLCVSARPPAVRTRSFLLPADVVTRAISTLGTTFPLLFAYLTFFEKFGAVIFFIIAQSLLFALTFYSAVSFRQRYGNQMWCQLEA